MCIVCQCVSNWEAALAHWCEDTAEIKRAAGVVKGDGLIFLKWWNILFIPLPGSGDKIYNDCSSPSHYDCRHCLSLLKTSDWFIFFYFVKTKMQKGIYIIVFYKICISTHHGFLQEGTHEKRVRRLNYCITCLCKDETKCSFQDVFIETQCLSCNVASVPLI